VDTKANASSCVYVANINAATSSGIASTDANSKAHFQLRGGIKGSVIVEVTDPQDPHPYWQVSTRKPESLIAALANAKNT
jgi:hypothetical protein